MHPADLSREGGWAARLRVVCLWLFALLPLALLFSRTVAEILMAVIGLSFLAVVIARRRWAIVAVPVFAVLVATWIYLMVLHAPLAWWDVTRVMQRSVPWLRFFCLFGAVVFWLFRDARDFAVVAWVWGATLAFCVVDGFVQGLFGRSLTGHPMFYGKRLTGPLDRPNIGRFSVVLFFPALAAYVLSRENRLDLLRQAVLAALTIVMLLFVTYSGERGATLLAFMTFVLAIMVAMIAVPRFRLAGVLVLVLGAVLTVATVWATARLNMRLGSTERVLSDFRHSEYGELVYIAYKVWWLQPWTGVGLGNFDRICEGLDLTIKYGCLRHPHNIYLEWLAATGVLGLAGFLAFVALALALVLGTWRHRRAHPYAVAVVIACPVLTLFPLVPSLGFFDNWSAMLWWASMSLTGAVAFHLRHRVPG